MKHMVFLLTITAVCVGCVPKLSTLTGVTPSSAPSTPLVIMPIQPTETALSTKPFTVVPTPEESVELPEFLESPCRYFWQDYTTPLGWSRYVNADYCFTFIYPSDWVLVVHRHFAILAKDETISLLIGFRKSGENVPIQRTGVGAGEIKTVGKIPFLGQEISKDLLVYNGNIPTVLYNYGTEISASDLVFAISGDNFAITLDDKTIAIFDKIVSSFQRIPEK